MLHKVQDKKTSTFKALTRLMRSVFIPVLKKVNAKECSDYSTIVLISQASKVMLKNPSN